MDIDKICMNYIRQELFLTVGLCLLTFFVMRVWYLDTLLAPAMVSVGFTLATAVMIALVWRRVAKGAPESLPTFFTAVSGFRMLLALAVMFVYYLADKATMLVFFLVFMAFYVVSLIHHSIFFAKVSNRS